LLEAEAKEAEARRRASERARTVREVSEAFLKACEKLKSHRQRKSHLNNHILPAMGDKLIAAIEDWASKQIRRAANVISEPSRDRVHEPVDLYSPVRP
jgi:hypothetical protein